jgi:hypothetical protein
MNNARGGDMRPRAGTKEHHDAVTQCRHAVIMRRAKLADLVELVAASRDLWAALNDRDVYNLRVSQMRLREALKPFDKVEV